MLMLGSLFVRAIELRKHWPEPYIGKVKAVFSSDSLL